jgi:hypothetical protein
MILVCDGADARRQREHDVEVGHLQQLGLARLHPRQCLRPLTLGAVPVAAGVIGDRRVAAVLAARNVATEGRRAAALDCAHHLHLHMTETALVGATPNGAVIAKDVRDLQTGTGHSRCRLQRRALAWPKRRKQIERARHIAQDLARDVGVARRRVQLGMSQ